MKHILLPLLVLAGTLLLPGCVSTDSSDTRSRRLMRTDPDAVTDRGGWVVLESGKKVATIYQQRTVHEGRDEGTYYVYDARDEAESGRELVGYITGISGQITIVGAGLEGDETRPTQEFVDVTSDRGLINAARFLMKLGGPLDIETAGQFGDRAK